MWADKRPKNDWRAFLTKEEEMHLVLLDEHLVTLREQASELCRQRTKIQNRATTRARNNRGIE